MFWTAMGKNIKYFVPLCLRGFNAFLVLRQTPGRSGISLHCTYTFYTAFEFLPFKNYDKYHTLLFKIRIEKVKFIIQISKNFIS